MNRYRPDRSSSVVIRLLENMETGAIHHSTRPKPHTVVTAPNPHGWIRCLVSGRPTLASQNSTPGGFSTDVKNRIFVETLSAASLAWTENESDRAMKRMYEGPVGFGSAIPCGA